MRSIIWLSLSIFLVLNGCALRTSNNETLANFGKNITNYISLYTLVPAPKEVLYQTEHILQKSYTAGKQETAFAGATIAKVKSYTIHKFRHKKVIAPYDITLKAKTTQIHLKKGVVYDVIGTMRADEKRYNVIMAGRRDALLLDSTDHLQSKVVYMNEGENNLLSNKFRVMPVNAKMKDATVERIVKVDDFNGYEIRYDGVDDKNFFMTYIEYVPKTSEKTGNFKKYAFDRNSSIITIHGVSLKILSTANNKLEYIVLEDCL
ncbi:MAG: hypothetical protein KAJ75_07925 [Alphaproteobacteria bacterium]|nr:hypothetical protein [Alphaproteobacteria bacterium]